MNVIKNETYAIATGHGYYITLTKNIMGISSLEIEYPNGELCTDISELMFNANDITKLAELFNEASKG